jgi:hypothetical protein
MAAHDYGLLSQAEEDDLHATRLLNIEERPFQRITRKLLEKDSLIRPQSRQLPSPPPDRDDIQDTPQDDAAEERKRHIFREEVLLDFANLESSITRIQLIQSSNARERERYAAEKAKILATAQSVRENTLLLREQLAEAQKVLEHRKGYDELASKILEDKKLKSRDECGADIATLEKEIEDLEQEGQDVEGLWTGRREQFERVVAEGEIMRRVMKGIKEPEEDDKDDDAMDDGEGEGHKEEGSRLGSPGVEDGRTPRHASGGQTPLPGDGTPLHESQMEGEGDEKPRNKFLEVEDAVRSSPRVGQQSGAETPADVEMSDSSQPKSSTGMEATNDPVMTPAEDAAEDMDES